MNQEIQVLSEDWIVQRSGNVSSESSNEKSLRALRPGVELEGIHRSVRSSHGVGYDNLVWKEDYVEKTGDSTQ
ncbi:hypothetical protein CPB86DRAFT_357723 [Serendipita vermifera]|nr:hypothetical protein CPB86DRAFT_357723 [Serendipita vermifera]